jgi:hypothetical protein
MGASLLNGSIEDQMYRPQGQPASGMGQQPYTLQQYAQPYAAQGIPQQMSADPGAINDSTVNAALAVLNRAPISRPMPAMRGSGAIGQADQTPYGEYLRTWGNIAPEVSTSNRVNQTPDYSGGDSSGGFSNQFSDLTQAQQAAYYAENPTMAGLTRAGQKAFAYTPPGMLMGLLAPEQVINSAIVAEGYTPAVYTSETGMGMGSKAGGTSYSNPQTIGIQDYANFGQVQSDSGMLSDSPTVGSISETGMGVNSAGQTVSNDATIAAQDAAIFGESAGSSSDSANKIICTAMNHAYGFGSFRNAIWIKYADKHLTKAHEVGYHTLFLPLVDFGFKRGNGKLNLVVRQVLEWGTRHRSTDLRAELRNKKRDTTGRIIRLIFEPLCYAVGKLKGY